VLFPVAADVRIETGTPDAVERVAPAAETDAGECVFRRRTLFPPGPTVQSVDSVLIEATPSAVSLDLTTSWTDREGTRHQSSHHVRRGDIGMGTFESDDTRVRVALQRYLAALRRWRTLAATESAGPTAAKSPGPSDASVSPHLELVEQRLRTALAETGADSLRDDIALLQGLRDA
jgi:hypothetical protein